MTDVQKFRITLAVLGLLAFALLVAATVYLAVIGQPVPAALTGAGAVALAARGLYRLLTVLGRSA